MARKKYQANEPKRITITIFLVRGGENLAIKSAQYDINTDIIEFKDLKEICVQFLREQGIEYETSIYIPDPANIDARIELTSAYQVNVQQIFQKMSGILILIIKGVIDELKQNFQTEIYHLRNEIDQLKAQIELLKKPLKDNLELLRKNSIVPMPMLTAQSTISYIEKQPDYIQLDIAILFSEPLYDEQKKKITSPAVDFRSEITRLNIALQNSFKPNIYMRCQIATFQSLQTIIKYSKPKILHIICHGNSQGNLQFEDDSRNTLGLLQLLKPSDIRNVLKGEKEILPSLVFINSCHSEEVGKAFFELGVPNVVMINSEDIIIDEAAQIFSQNFYRKIFKGVNVNQAFKSSKQRVEMRHAGGICCCNHSPSLEPHRPDCQWVKMWKKESLQAHRIYHVPSAKCECQLRNLNRHSLDCQWAQKTLFQINKDFRVPMEGSNEMTFPKLIQQLPDYVDREKKELIICCCPPPKDRKPHSESIKFKILSKDDGKSVLMPITHNREHPQVSDLTSVQLLEAHEKSKAIFGRQRQLFEFLKQIKDVNFIYAYGKSGVGLTTFTVKASTYMMQRRVFQFFFFIDLYDIKDETVFRYKFNQVTKFQYDGRNINQFGMRNRKILLLFDNCDYFINNKDAERFYEEIRTLLREIPKCKIIITFKEESKQNFDDKKIVGQKYQLLPFQLRPAIYFLNSKMKDKTDISVGIKEYRTLISKYEVLRIPKVIQSVSQSFPITQKRVTLAQIEKNVESIKLNDTNKLTQSVLEQLKQRSKQAYEFLLFVSQFSDGVTFEDINMFSTYFRKDMSIQLPVRKNWQEHYLMLFQKDEVIAKKNASDSLSPLKFETIASQREPIINNFFDLQSNKPEMRKKESSQNGLSLDGGKNQFEALDKIKEQSYFVDRAGPGRFIVKRFIRDYVWKKHENETTKQIKFLFVAYFSVILEMLFQTLSQGNFIHEDLTTYSAISSAGIFSFKTTLQAMYQKRVLTESVRFAKEFITDLDVIFIKNEQLLDKMKKTDHSTFIMNHRQDFLKLYDTNWVEVYNFLLSRNKGEQKIFVTLLINLIVYIPTAFKIANAQPSLIKYVLRGSQRELKIFKPKTSPERYLKIQLKLIFTQIGISLQNESQVRNLLDNGLKLIRQFSQTNESSAQFKDIQLIFYEEQFTCDLFNDSKNLKMQTMNDLNHLVNKKVEYLSRQESMSLEPIIKAKQGLIISSLFLKFLIKDPVDISIFLTSRAQGQNFDQSYQFSRHILQICNSATRVFAQKKCQKLKLKSQLIAIQLFWQFSQKLKSNRKENFNSEDIEYWRNKLTECQRDYFEDKNKLRGFTEFDDKIKQLKQRIKEKLWMSASKRMIFMKAYPLSSKDYPIIKNLIRRKNNYRQQIQRIFLNMGPKQVSKEHLPSERKIGLSPALKSKQSRINTGQKRMLDISTKYQILTGQKITEEARARCSIMFINVDVRTENEKIYFICENQIMQEELVELNAEFVANFNMDNMLILVLTGVNTRLATAKICSLSNNPPIIIALNSQPIQNYDQIDYGHYLQTDFIIELVKRQNQIKQAQLVYTKQFIRKITKQKIQSNEQVKKIHMEAVKKMETDGLSHWVRPFIEMSRCRKNIHLHYSEGIYRDLSPGYEGNHNIDSKSYDTGISIRRWRKMLEFFSILRLNRIKKINNENLNTENRKGQQYLMPSKEEQLFKVDLPASYINIYGENGCGKTFFIRQIAKILVEREFYDFGVFLFEGKRIQKNFNGDFEAYIKKQASIGKMPVFEDFEKLLGDKTILIVDDFHLIRPRVNARMKIFLDKVIAKKVNLILVSLNDLKLDYLPTMKKIKLGMLDSVETEILAYNLINIYNQDEIRVISELFKKAKTEARLLSIKEVFEMVERMRKYKNNFPYEMQETTAEEGVESTMKKSFTTYG